MILLQIFTVAFFLSSANGQSVEEKIDVFVEAVMECADVPGLMLTVVRDGEDFIVKGYGTRDQGPDAEPVTNETLFVINSVTKAFLATTAAVVIKNNPDRLDWWMPLRPILGDDFYLADAHATEHFSLRDLLGHRVGLPANSEFRLANWTQEEAINRLRFLDFTADFRDVYKYSNLMYGLAAYTIQQIDGRRWEDIAREELFVPLGMEKTTFAWDEDRWPEMATPHAPYEDGRRSISLRVTKAYYGGVWSAAGAIASTAADMRHWIKFHLNDGEASDGTVILPPNEFRWLHYAVVARSLNPRYERPEDPVTYGFGEYGLGWQENIYRDFLISQHYGSLAGFNSLLTIFRSTNHGIHTTLNVDIDYGARDNIHMYIMDLLLGYEPWLNASSACDRITKNKESYQKSSEAVLRQGPCTEKNRDDEICQKEPEKRKNQGKLRNLKRKENTYSSDKEDHNPAQPSPAADNSVFLGTYGHFAYGNVTVFETTGDMYMTYGKEDYVWRLYTIPGENVTYSAVGMEPIWYEVRTLAFNFDDPNQPAISVEVSFDDELPPVFARDLDWDNPPAPPNICS